MLKKNWGEKNFWTPLPEKTGPRKEKTRKWQILGLKRAKYDQKNELLKFFLINPLKGSKTRNLAKNHNIHSFYPNL